jgi:hypothetical protein
VIFLLGDDPDGIVDIEDDGLVRLADFDGSSADDDGLDGGGAFGWFGAVAFEGEEAGLSVDDVGVGAVDGVELVTRARFVRSRISKGYTSSQHRREFGHKSCP